MGFMDEYNKALQENKQKSSAKSSGGSSSGGSGGGSSPKYVGTGHESFYKNTFDAPISKKLTSSYKKKKKEKEKKRRLFTKGAFEDGYDIGDVTKTILGTAGDVATGVVKGFTSGVEGITDLGMYGVAGVLDAVGKDDSADRLRESTARSQTDQLWGGLEKTADKYSVLGDRVDSVVDPITQALGYIGLMYATAGIGAAAGVTGAGATALSTGTMFTSSAGGAMGEAYQGGASDEEALKHGVMKGAVDAGSELIFGGLGKGAKALGLSRGLSSLDDIFAKKLSSKISNHFWKNAVQYGVKASAEGVEEVLAGLGSAVSKKLTYMSDKELSELIKDENLMEQFAVGMASSAIMQSGYVPGTAEGSLREANKTGKDFITGQTQNEQAVIQKELENRIAEAEKDGTKLTNKQKADIEAEVVEAMEKGYISVDTIVEAIGGEKYDQYKQAADWESSLQTEYDTLSKEYEDLGQKENPTLKDQSRYSELKEMLPDMKKRLDNVLATSTVKQQKAQLTHDIYQMSKSDRLAESFFENVRTKQKFDADLSKYDEKQKTVVQKAIDSGILNNSRRTHEFVDFIAKVSADKGVLFDFTNNAKLKESGFAVDGKQVNGFVTKDGITLNIDSAKAMNTTVGHEITHVLEGTEFYDSMKQTIFDYAKAKGEYQSRYDSIAEMYKDVKDADIEGELTADLVGDYLFSDSDFINTLSTQNRNVFQKIYDEIKYLCKVVTAGSKEARELERVKKAFDKAYREGGKAQTDEIKKPESSTTVSANESPNSILEDSDGTNVPQNGNEVNISLEQNEHGLNREEEVSFSLSNDTAYMDKAIAMNASSLRVDSKTLEETKALRERIAARMNDIKDRGLVGLPEDIEGNTYIANSSYDGTEENTTICPRSLASEAFVDAVSEYLGRPLTVEEQIYISQDLQGRSLTPECTYCYVATDRKAYRAFLGEYVAQRDAVLQKVKDNPNADVSRSGELYKEFLNGRKDTNPMYSRFKMWVDAYKNGKPMIDASHLANINKLMGDINSEFGAELKPQITDAIKYAQSASWAKKRVNYVAYNGHILKWKQDRINKLNSHYGLRMYSFSDFHPAFVLENMQMITDASVRGLKMLGYTKDTDFVDIFAPSGMNINISTFGFETGGNVFENNLIGAEWEKAKALRDQYPNVGITFVATNDTLVDWALNQDWIDVVIPFHLVRTGREVAKAFNYHDYTSESSDTKTKEWKKGDKKYIAPTEHNNDKATYLAALESNHLKPRFERFLENPNYMKLVNECRQPASVSKPVQPVFNEDAAKVALAKLEANGYYQPIGGSVDRMYEIAGEVAEAMTKELAPSMSISDVGQEHKQYGNWNVYAKDILLDESDIAPVAENATTAETESAPVTQEAPIYESNDKSAPEGQTAMFEPVEEKRTTRKEYHQSIIDNIKDRFDEEGFDFDNVLKNAKNLSTWSTVDNTPQRVMEKALGYKEGGILSDITVNKVAQNETEGIKWLNSYVDQLKQISKQYHIKPGSKESSAAQMFAEGFYVKGTNKDGEYVKGKSEIVSYGDTELAIDFPDPKVRANIKMLARDPRIRKIYDDTLANINESRTRNLYPEIPRLDNYFMHFRAMEDTYSALGLPFNPNDIRAKDLPTDLNGVTADLKPGQPFFASAMHREGKRTSFDLLGGVERYLNSAKNQIYHIDDIQTLRALRNYIADTYGQAKGLENLDELSQDAQWEQIKKVYNSHLSTFAKFLNEEANILAGKTTLIDRGVEGFIGRRGITFLDTLNKQVGSNMVGYNVSSSLTNFLPVAQTFAKTNKFDFTKAFAQTVANKLSGGRFDSFAEDSPVVIRRKGEDRFYRTLWQKMADPGYALMGMVDDISTEIIARTKYNEFTRKGMDSQKAHFETDKWVSKLMGDRSLGQQPQLYNSKMLGLVTKFQLEVRNQLDSQFYDTIQETKASNEHIQNGLARNAKTAAKVASVFTQLAVAQHLYGKAFESIAGYNPAFDIIEVLMTAFGYDDEEDSEDTALDNFAQGLLALAEDMPYSSFFLEGGRIPIASAIPDVPAVMRGEDQYGNDIGWKKAAVEEFDAVAPYYLLPGGGGQIKKTAAGLKMFSDDHPIAGSYTDAGNLRFNVEDTVGNRIKAGIFGQYASENARKYFDQEQRTLNPEQTEIFAGLNIPIEEYWEYRDNLYEFYDVKDKLKEAAYADEATDEDVLRYTYINNAYGSIYDLYDKQKELASGDSPNKKTEMREIQDQMAQMLSDSKYAVDRLKLSGAYGEVGDKRYNKDVDSDRWYEIKPKNADGSDNWYYQKEQEVTKGLGISYEEYWNNREEYNYAYDKPGRYAIAQTVGGYDSYMEYYDVLENWQSDNYLSADKDEKGNSISGSRKKKVQEYIDGLDLDYGEKIILYRTVYSSKADKRAYNQDIIDYLNERDDISYQEMKSILEELDFEVDSEGYITW